MSFRALWKLRKRPMSMILHRPRQSASVILPCSDRRSSRRTNFSKPSSKKSHKRRKMRCKLILILNDRRRKKSMKFSWRKLSSNSRKWPLKRNLSTSTFKGGKGRQIISMRVVTAPLLSHLRILSTISWWRSRLNCRHTARRLMFFAQALRAKRRSKGTSSSSKRRLSRLF